MAAERGNYRAAGSAGVKTVVLGMAAGVGIAQGVGALATRGITAETGAASLRGRATVGTATAHFARVKVHRHHIFPQAY